MPPDDNTTPNLPVPPGMTSVRYNGHEPIGEPTPPGGRFGVRKTVQDPDGSYRETVVYVDAHGRPLDGEPAPASP